LAQAILGSGTNVDERTVDVEIGRIRALLNRGTGVDPIPAIRGAGYAFDEEYGMFAALIGQAKPKRKIARARLTGTRA
jgi:hypothetical protein